MRRGKNVLMIMAGVLIGMTLTGPAARAAAEYLKALPSGNVFYLDGQQIKLEAYTINGSNYVRLRDVGEAMDFNVYWDGTVQIDSGSPYTGTEPEADPHLTTEFAAQAAQASASYTIHADHWSREDFSQQANPAIFTGIYDRALYNTIRQTIVDGTSDAPAYTMVSDSAYSAVKNLLGRLEGVVRYEHYVPENFANYWEHPDYFAVSAEMPENYQAALDFVRPITFEVGRLVSDEEKVTRLNDYLCTLLSYDRTATAGIVQTFSPHDGELNAACGSYARAFKFLCAAADIPCFTISTTSHAWNMVYADGQWLHVDVSANDLYNSNSILLSKTIPNRIDQAPETTAFLKELLAPGSTK